MRTGREEEIGRDIDLLKHLDTPRLSPPPPVSPPAPTWSNTFRFAPAVDSSDTISLFPLSLAKNSAVHPALHARTHQTRPIN